MKKTTPQARTPPRITSSLKPIGSYRVRGLRKSLPKTPKRTAK